MKKKMAEIVILSAISAFLSFGLIEVAVGNSKQQLGYPLANKKILRGFEESNRQGIILDAKKGDAVFAAGDGVVIYWSKAVGLHNPRENGILIIDHGDNFRTRYTNLKNINVRVGKRIKKGEKIGFLNKYHTFFSLINNNISVNPRQFIDF